MTQTVAQQLAAQSKKARAAIAFRDELIHRMRAEGATLRAIAEAAGLNHQTVANILGR